MHSLGPSWMDPNYLLERFGTAITWVSLVFVFVECGLLFPFLPGDSLLFAMGFFAATGKLSLGLPVILVLLFVAAFAGNVVGYEIGRAAGPALYRRDGRLIKREYFDQTHAFFDRHGRKALVIGRFVPIVRTFITVVAGVGRMDRRHFFTWSAVGAALWVGVVTLAGYFLGQAFPVLQDKLEIVILLIVLVSLLPAGYEWWRHRRSSSAGAADVAERADEPVEGDSR